MNTGALATEKFKKIPASEVEFHKGYLGDPNGRLFTWRGELYRGIAHHRADFYLGLFESGIVRRLIATGHLVTTDLTDLQLDGYARSSSSTAASYSSPIPSAGAGQCSKTRPC